jgi:hypothetical protein
MFDCSKLKFGEREEVIAWVDEYVDHDAACQILAPQFDRRGGFSAPMPDDWRSYFSDEELRDYVVEHVMFVADVPA